jgi:hypothetical protein
MAMGSLTLACALLLANVELPEIMPMNQGSFTIPIRVAPERRSAIKELRLYVSHDLGATWAVEGRATPDQASFPYKTTSDGMYWFNVAIIDQQNQQEPVDLYTAPVGLRVLVDTRKPDIRLTRADRVGDEVQVQWDIREDNPDLKTLRLEYCFANQGGSSWTPVSVRPALQGETSFRVAGPGDVQVRMLLNDLAGNQGQVTDGVKLAGAVATPLPEPAGVGPAAVLPPPGTVPSYSQPQPGAIAGTPIGEYHRSQPSEPARPQYRPADEVPPPGRQVVLHPIEPQPPVQNTVASSEANRNAIQTTSGTDRTSSAVQQYTPVRGGLSPVEIVNKNQAKIVFQVGKYGPSGLGSVDVYVTTDDGATWALSPGDRSVTLPTAAEMQSGAPVAASVMVELKQEGIVYGYYTVVKSRAGLGKKPPEPGTPPQVRIEMDITPPSVEMYVPQPDPAHRDTLLLTWKATDKNLTNNSVTIEWAERKEGQWNVIGTEKMSNTGQFSWQVPANVPPSVYLRLAVRDTAGNEAVAQTQEPVLVDLSVPETGGFKVAR